MIGIFEGLRFGDFTVNINNRKVLLGFMQSLGVPDEQQPDVLREIDKIDKRGVSHLREALASEALGVNAEIIDRIADFVEISGQPRQVLAGLRAMGIDNETFAAGVGELGTVVDGLEALGANPARYRLNVAIARGLDYYTGTVYETFLDAHPELGSVCSGGRYENLASLYTKSSLPGVGMSIGLTRLFYQLRELGLVGEGDPTTAVLVTQQDPDLLPEYLAIASELRSAGVPTESVLEPWKFRKQMKYANASGIPLVVIVGENERAAGQVTLKDMRSGEQETVTRAALVETVQSKRAEG